MFPREFYFAQKHKNTKTQKHKLFLCFCVFVFLCFCVFVQNSLKTYTAAEHFLGENPKFANKKVYMRRNSV